MKSRTWIIAGVAAAVIIASGGLFVSQLPGRTTAEGPATHTSSSSPSSPSPTASKAPTSSAPASPNPAAPSPPPSKRITGEIVPGQGGKAALPKPTDLPEPISNPLPSTASAVGSLAKGYPSSVLPTAPNSSITNSSVASQGRHLQVTLTARSSISVTDVLAFYRTTLAKYGMYDNAAPALGGATALTFKRGTDSVTLTTSPVTGGTTYIIYGAFTAKG